MRYWRLILSIVMLSLSLYSCKQNRGKIAFMLPNTKADRYKKEKTFFIEKVKELGFETLFYDAENDQSIQIKQAQDAIDKGADILVISSVNINTAAEIVRFAHKNNVKVIAYDRFILNSDVDFYITFNYKEIGKLMANYMIQKRPSGNYVLMDGEKSDYNALQIYNGQIETLKPFIDNKKITITYQSFIEEWSAENCEQELKRLINWSGIMPDVILASSDKLALGASNALNSFPDSNNVLISGMDGDLSACKRILSGTQTFSIYKPNKQLAIMAAEIAIHIVKEGKYPETNQKINNGKKDIPVLFLEPQLIDKENIRQIMINNNIYTEKELSAQLDYTKENSCYKKCSYNILRMAS